MLVSKLKRWKYRNEPVAKLRYALITRSTDNRQYERPSALWCSMADVGNLLTNELAC